MSEREQKPPPCLDSEKCPRVAACLESSKLCHELGRVGSYRPCGIGRRPLMIAVAVAGVLALLLNVYALFSLSADAKVVRPTAWAVGDVVAFSTALGPMLAFQKHCTRSNTDMLKMRAGPSYICMGFAVFLKATTVVAHLALRAPGNPAEESVARRLAWISMD